MLRDIEALVQRCKDADKKLKALAAEHPPGSPIRDRLVAKASGVRLALSYIEETARDLL